jgi:hypothetical protein
MAGGKAYNNDVAHIVEGKHITGKHTSVIVVASP